VFIGQYHIENQLKKVSVVMHAIVSSTLSKNFTQLLQCDIFISIKFIYFNRNRSFIV